MKNYATIFLCILLAAPGVLKTRGQVSATPPGFVMIQEVTHVRGAVSQNCEWLVATNVLAHQPQWDGRTSPVPLSRTNAVLLTFPQVKSHYTNIQNWKVESVTLRNLSWNRRLANVSHCSNVWFYLVSFEPADDQKAIAMINSGQDFYLDQLVLMDGTLVEPVVKEVDYLKTRMMKDARALIEKTASGPVSPRELPVSIRSFYDSKSALVTNGVLVLYLSPNSGKILNPSSRNSLPNIGGFKVELSDHPGVFDFRQ